MLLFKIFLINNNWLIAISSGSNLAVATDAIGDSDDSADSDDGKFLRNMLLNSTSNLLVIAELGSLLL